MCKIPVVGIVKRDLAGYDVRITPTLEDVRALSAAGASVIAFDATDRDRPVPARSLLERIWRCGSAAMADCASLADAVAMADAGCDYLATTLSGYTGSGPVPRAPDIALVRQLAARGYKVVAEGRYNTPALGREAIQAGAFAVTVGTAITRTETVTHWFVDALQSVKRSTTAETRDASGD